MSSRLLAWCALGLALTIAGRAPAATINALVKSSDGEPLADAVVSVIIDGNPQAALKPGDARATIVQEGMQFLPKVLPIQVGTTVEFPNRDPFRHHVYSFSPVHPFELKLYGGDDIKTETFNEEGAVPLGCNIHDSMIGYIYVVPTPHFGATAADGRLRVESLPAGSYTVKVWHPNQRAGSAVAQPVALTADQVTDLDLTVELKRSRRQRGPGAADDAPY